MINLKKCCILFMSFLSVQSYGQELVKITPEKPQALGILNISFNPKGSKIPDTVNRLFVNFTSSNFYELPSKLPMQKVDGTWTILFNLPFYERYGSFTISDIDKKYIQQPTDTYHYEFFVYKGDISWEWEIT